MPAESTWRAKARCFCHAFQISAGSGQKPFLRKYLEKIEAWGQAIGIEGTVIDFPSLPVFNIDSMGPVYFQSAIVWADHDVVAGKRKVNLVFNMIDAYEQIYRDLCGGVGPMRDELATLWSKDVNGQHVAFASDVIDDFWKSVAEDATADNLFQAIRSSAKIKFPKDYIGGRFPLSETEVRERSEWLQTCVANAAIPFFLHRREDRTALVVGRAVTELRNSGFGIDGHFVGRNHSYGHYSLPWNSSIAAFNTRLRKLALSSILGLEDRIGSNHDMPSMSAG